MLVAQDFFRKNMDDNVTDILKVSEGRWYRSRALCLLLVLFWIWF